MKNLIALAVLFFFGRFLQAQTVPISPNGYWITYLGDNKLNERIGVHSEGQIRNALVDRTVFTLLVRTGINFYLQPYAMATVGYGYFYFDPSQPDLHASRISENRAWQQLILTQKSRNIFIEHRFRSEQRFLNNLTHDAKRTEHRIRYRFQALFPLYSISPHLRHLFFAFNNELMIKFEKNTADLFDRNRLFLGIGYQFHPKLNVQIGYMNQFAQVQYNPHGFTEHILLMGVSYNMDDLMQTFFKKPDK